MDQESWPKIIAIQIFSFQDFGPITFLSNNGDSSEIAVNGSCNEVSYLNLIKDFSVF